jgi:hypothetical protein
MHGSGQAHRMEFLLDRKHWLAYTGFLPLVVQYICRAVCIVVSSNASVDRVDAPRTAAGRDVAPAPHLKLREQ